MILRPKQPSSTLLRFYIVQCGVTNACSMCTFHRNKT